MYVCIITKMKQDIADVFKICQNKPKKFSFSRYKVNKSLNDMEIIQVGGGYYSSESCNILIINYICIFSFPHNQGWIGEFW